MKDRGINSRLDRRHLFLSTIFITLTFFTAGCGSGGEGPNPGLSAQAVTTTLGELQVGSVASIPLGGGVSEIRFDKLTGREKFILVASSANQGAGSFPFELQGSQTLPIPSSPDPLLTDHQAMRSAAEGDPTVQFHEFLRDLERSLPAGEENAPSKSMESVWKEASVGERVSLKVLNRLNSSESYTPITAEVRYVTPHFVVFMDTASLNTLSDSDLRSLIDPFEARVEEEYSTFGAVSDTDQNGKVAIVFSPVLNGMGGSGGVVTGFFFSGDLYPDRFAASNGGEYIYCHVPDEAGQWGVAVPKAFYLSNTGPLCFPHELQHAIHFNQKVFVAGGAPDPPPFNEGLSHLAEDIFTGFAKTSAENPSRVNLYLTAGLPSFTGGISLAERGGAYLFFRYLFEQGDLKRFPAVENGRALIRRILGTKQNGFDAVEEATQDQTASLLSDFFSAIYLSNTGLNEDPRFNFRGISLRGPQNDNRSTVLAGPPVTGIQGFPVSESVFAVSARYKEITGEMLLQSGSALKLAMDPNSVPGAMLIRIEDE